MIGSHNAFLRAAALALLVAFVPSMASAAGLDSPFLAAAALSDIKKLVALGMGIMALIIGAKNYPLIAEGFSDIGNQREGGMQKMLGGLMAPGAFILIAVVMSVIGLGDAAIDTQQIATELRR